MKTWIVCVPLLLAGCAGTAALLDRLDQVEMVASDAHGDASKALGEAITGRRVSTDSDNKILRRIETVAKLTGKGVKVARDVQAGDFTGLLSLAPLILGQVFRRKR